MGLAAQPVIHRIAGDHNNVGAAEETVLQFPATDGGSNFRNQMWLLLDFHYTRSGGTAATFAPTLYEGTPSVALDQQERFSYTAQAVATPINDRFDPPIVCKPDSNGRLYFKPGFNAGADNDGKYTFDFQKVSGV